MKGINKQIVVFSCCFLLVATSFGCNRGSMQSSNISATPAVSNVPLPAVDEITATVSNKPSVWSVKKYQIPGKPDLERITFLNDRTGFAMGPDRLFRTDDGGASWQQASVIKDRLFIDLHFISVEEGYAVVRRTEPNEDLEKIPRQPMYVLATKDGGKNWTEVYSLETSRIERISANANGLVIIVGRNQSGGAENLKNFIALSQDKGHTWQDISRDLNRMIRERNEKGTRDNLTDLTIREGRIYVISVDGLIFESIDLGKTWDQQFKLPERAIKGTGFGQIGVQNGTRWLSGGAKNDHGTWTLLAATEGNKWMLSKLSGYFLSDIRFLSDQEIIGVGVEGDMSVTDHGVILASSDQGKTWSTVYKSANTKKFFSIAFRSDNELVIAGGNGEIVILQRTPLNRKPE